MIKRLKKYIEYKRNRKKAKQELAKFCATIFPTIRIFSENRVNLLHFIIKLVNSVENVNDEEFLGLIIKEIADKLATDEIRLIEILHYIINLSPEDINKLIVHSISETMENIN